MATIGELAKICVEIREQGYSADDAEFQEGVRCVAAPVFDASGGCCGAIGVSYLRDAGPATDQVAARVMRAAATASSRFLASAAFVVASRNSSASRFKLGVAAALILAAASSLGREQAPRQSATANDVTTQIVSLVFITRNCASVNNWTRTIATAVSENEQFYSRSRPNRFRTWPSLQAGTQ